MSTIHEIKRNLDGRELRFECQFLGRGPDWMAIHYVSQQSYDFRGVHLPCGSQTVALYQAGQPYVFWQMTSPAGELVGYYIHLADNVTLEADCVTWKDLTVDIWVYPDGRYELWDEEELSKFWRQGFIDDAQLSEIKQVKAQVLADLTGIIARCQARLREVSS